MPQCACKRESLVTTNGTQSLSSFMRYAAGEKHLDCASRRVQPSVPSSAALLARSNFVLMSDKNTFLDAKTCCDLLKSRSPQALPAPCESNLRAPGLNAAYSVAPGQKSQTSTRNADAVSQCFATLGTQPLVFRSVSIPEGVAAPLVPMSSSIAAWSDTTPVRR